MAHIYAFISCTRVKWEGEDPIEEHGWIDWDWSPYVLFDGRNEVGPVMKCDENDEFLASDVQEALGRLEGDYEDNGDGTFCAKGSYQPHDSEWSYTYALHFTRKGYGTDGWYEEPWHPFKDGRLMWHEGELTGPHVDYPHGAGTLYDCFACEEIMNEED